MDNVIALKIANARIAMLQAQLAAAKGTAPASMEVTPLNPVLSGFYGSKLFANSYADLSDEDVTCIINIFDEDGKTAISKKWTLAYKRHWWKRQKPATKDRILAGSIKTLCRLAGLALFGQGIEPCGCQSYRLAVNWNQCIIL